MIGNLVGLGFLIALVVLGALLTYRSSRARPIALRFGGTALAGFLTLAVGAITVAIGLGSATIYLPRGNPVQNVAVARTPGQIARGQHIANMLCAACHSLNNSIPLSGGKDLGKEVPFPIGSLTTKNLTPAGPLKNWTDGEIYRAVREGTDNNGHTLPVMSTQSFRTLGDDDLQSLIAYLRTQPAVQNEVPDESLSLLGLALTGVGLIPVLPVPTQVVAAPAPPREPRATYGQYVVTYTGCSDCHGENLTGGTNPLAPRGPSLQVAKNWSSQQFQTTLRTGTDPTGYHLNDQMPWQTYGRMDDDELAAVHAYLVSLP
jgi:mono/diheme cytochrome c family protein